MNLNSIPACGFESHLLSLKHGSSNMRILTLNVKREYFEAIKNGSKIEEYRIVTPYWSKRLAKDYDEIHILCGYPRKDDNSRRLIFPYRGWIRKEIVHKHFGSEPVKVFAIRLANKALAADSQSLAAEARRYAS